MRDLGLCLLSYFVEVLKRSCWCRNVTVFKLKLEYQDMLTRAAYWLQRDILLLRGGVCLYMFVLVLDGTDGNIISGQCISVGETIYCYLEGYYVTLL